MPSYGMVIDLKRCYGCYACSMACKTANHTPPGVFEDGVVIVEKDLCMGCKYCIMACPYGARYSVEEWESYFPDGLPLSPLEEFQKKEWEKKSGCGVATKCDFCLDRIAEGRDPACVEACPAKARIFGDLDDPNSEVSILIKKERGQVLNPELGNKPKVYYLLPR
jgi:molybdopterin-containing oxidoreductase family iron-sulfur binding subunit